MTGPEQLQEGDLALVHPLVRVVFLETLNKVPGAVVRDVDGYEQWVPIRWLMRLPVDKQPDGGQQ